MKHIEIDVFYPCVNRCIFCGPSVAMRSFRSHSLTTREVLAILTRKRREGFSHVNFTGGEPSLHPDIDKILASARRLGFRVHMTTCVAPLARAGIAAKVLPHVDELLASVMGPTAAIHDGLTRTPRSYARLRVGLERVQACDRDIFVVTNTVLTALNADYLRDIILMTAPFGKIREHWFTGILPVGSASDNYTSIAIPYSQLTRQVPDLIETAARHGRIARFFNLPFCVLGRHAHHSGDLVKPPSRSFSRRLLTPDPPQPFVHEESCPQPIPCGKKSLESCAACVMREACGGPLLPYFNRFGADGLNALREPLAAVPPTLYLRPASETAGQPEPEGTPGNGTGHPVSGAAG